MTGNGKRSGSSSSFSNGLLPNSLKVISSCLKTVSSNASSAVRSASATVAASVAAAGEHEKEEVIWAGFDKLELGPSVFRHVLLLAYSNGFQVIDVEDASNVRELVSKRDGPLRFLQIQPIPLKSDAQEGFRSFHPLLLVVAGDEANSSGVVQGCHLSSQMRDNVSDYVSTPSIVRFYSLMSDSYVHALRFRSVVHMIRCSPRIIAVALSSQIYCFDAATLENKFSVLTYPMPQGVQGAIGVNIGYGPMSVGARWLAYTSNNPLFPNMGRLSPQNLTPSPGTSPSSPGSGSLVARYALESSKQLAAGIINLGDMGYKTLSKYCQELLPDGSNSPLPSTSSRKVGKVASAAHPSETENAGMVVIKDFVSRAIISQFRAHTSPISALCFDPSGTLLVTASVHGHNVNVFRIMPSHLENRSGSMHYDWSSSHVHLYKLYRGLTTAVIQDICFSHQSQWVAIVSSRGTCHIFVLSPFGGDVGLQTQSFSTDGPVLPILSMPWWSTSSYTINQPSHPPPPPITLSVVSRIKHGTSGWLNTVSNAAASAAGKTSVPSVAVAAAFHDSIHCNLRPVQSKANSLEHLLVYSPSGHVVQHELVPSLVVESCERTARSGPGLSVPAQDEEFRVNAEPVQWWDVCRRSNWPEREKILSNITFDREESAKIALETSDYEDCDTKCLRSYTNSITGKDVVKTHEKSHWYLANAEVQISSGRTPLWQNSKVCFYTIIPSNVNESKLANDYCDGEIEIENVPGHEFEIKRRCLLPIFEQFQGIQSDWNGRGFALPIAASMCENASCARSKPSIRGLGGRYLSASTSHNHQTKDKFTEENFMSYSKSASSVSAENLDVGSTRKTENVLYLDRTSMMAPHVPIGFQSMGIATLEGSVQTSALKGHLANWIDTERRGHPVPSLPQMNASTRIPSRNSSDQDCLTSLSKHSEKDDCYVINNPSSSASNSRWVGKNGIVGALSLKKGDASEVLTASMSYQSASITNNHTEETEHADLPNSLDFAQFFHEGYCKVSELDCHELTGVAPDVDSNSSHRAIEKPEADGDHNQMFEGAFATCGED